MSIELYHKGFLSLSKFNVIRFMYVCCMWYCVVIAIFSRQLSARKPKMLKLVARVTTDQTLSIVRTYKELEPV